MSRASRQDARIKRGREADEAFDRILAETLADVKARREACPSEAPSEGAT